MAAFGRSRLAAEDFFKVSGNGPDTPGFSATSPPIQVGYVSANTIPPPGVSVTVVRTSGIDNWSVSINPADLSVASACPLPSAAPGESYVQTLVASGGLPAYRWALTAGALPPGLTLTTLGVLSGSPTTAGLYLFTLQVTDSRGSVALKECSLRVLGPITVSPASINLTGFSGGPATAPVNISVTGDQAGLPFNVLVPASGVVNWLRINTAGGRAPSIFQAIGDPSLLGPGIHRAQVSIVSEQASPRSSAVSITFMVGEPEPPKLAAQPTGLLVTAPPGTGVVTRIVNAVNLGIGGIPFSATATELTGGEWCSITPGAGTAIAGAPVPLRVRFALANLGPGIYRGRITLSGGGGAVIVPVTVAISNSREAMVVPETGLTFPAVVGGPAPPPQRFRVLAAGALGFAWQAAESAAPGEVDFVTLSPTRGTSAPGESPEVEVRVDHTGLAPGQHFVDFRVTAPGVDNSPRVGVIALNVFDANSMPGVQVSPTGLLFTTEQGRGSPPRRTIQLFNPTSRPVTMSFDLTGQASIWTLRSLTGSTIAPGATGGVDVGAVSVGLAPGVYRASLALQFSGDPAVTIVDLLLVVSPARPTAADQKGPETRTAHGGCHGTRLLPVSTLTGTGFVAAGGLPLPMEVRVTDDCANPLVSGAVTASFSTNTPPPVSLVHLGDGRWSGTWAVQSAGGAVTITVSAQDAAGSLQGSVQITGAVTENIEAPVIAEGGVISTASFLANTPLAPGGLFAAFGAQLADGISESLVFPLLVQLGTTRVSLGGREVPLFFAGRLATFSQINGMLPYELAVNTSHQFVLRRGSRRSNIVDLVLAATQPAVFTTSQSGSGQGVVVNGADMRIVVDTANPIPTGGVVVIYAEGLGATNPLIEAGQMVPFSPLAHVTSLVRVTIGGLDAQVLFAGLTPGLAGLYQVNAFVPAGVTPASAVPVVLTVGGQVSPPVTIAVR